MGGAISGRKGPVVPSLLQNKKVGGAKVHTGFIKIITGLNKIKEKVKALRKAIRVFI